MAIERYKKDEIRVDKIATERQPERRRPLSEEFEEFYPAMIEEFRTLDRLITVPLLDSLRTLILLFPSRREEVLRAAPFIDDSDFWSSFNTLIQNQMRTAGDAGEFLLSAKVAAPKHFQQEAHLHQWKNLFMKKNTIGGHPLNLLEAVATFPSLLPIPKISDGISLLIEKFPAKEMMTANRSTIRELALFRLVNPALFDNLFLSPSTREKIGKIVKDRIAFIYACFQKDVQFVDASDELFYISVLLAKRVINTDEEFRLIMPEDEPDVAPSEPVPISRNF